MSSTVDFEETFGQTCPLSLPRWKYFTDRQSCQLFVQFLGVRLRRTLYHFIMNPAISAFESIAQLYRRFPAENFLDQRVIAVAAVHAFRRIEIVIPLQFHPGDIFHDVDQLIDRNEFAAAEVERLDEIAVHDHLVFPSRNHQST